MGADSKSIVKWTGGAIGVGLLGVILMAFIAIDGPRALWYAVVPSYRYSEVKVDLTLDGERIELSAVAGCRYRQSTDVPLVTNLSSGYYIKGGALAKRLPDGRGLVVIPGTFCSAFQNLSGRKEEWRPLPNSLRGLHILILDNADNPTVIGYPILPQYLDQPEARIAINSIEYRERDSADITDPTQEVGWLEWPESPVGNDSSHVWIGRFAAIIPERQWKNVEQIASAFADRTTPSADVYAELQTVYDDLDFGALPDFEDRTKVNVLVDDYAVRLSTNTKPWWVELHRTSARAFEVSPRGCQTGINAHARLTPPQGLQVDGRVIAPEVGITALSFDPKTRTLVKIGTVCATSNRILKR